jgi:hypothetical protein
MNEFQLSSFDKDEKGLLLPSQISSNIFLLLLIDMINSINFTPLLTLNNNK